MVFYNLSNSNSGTFSDFAVFEKNVGKVFGKNTVTFWHKFAYMVNLFVFITYDNYD